MEESSLRGGAQLEQIRKSVVGRGVKDAEKWFIVCYCLKILVRRVAGLCIVFCRISQRQPQKQSAALLQSFNIHIGTFLIDFSGRLMAGLFSRDSTTGTVHRC